MEMEGVTGEKRRRWGDEIVVFFSKENFLFDKGEWLHWLRIGHKRLEHRAQYATSHSLLHLITP